MPLTKAYLVALGLAQIVHFTEPRASGLWFTMTTMFIIGALLACFFENLAEDSRADS